MSDDKQLRRYFIIIGIGIALFPIAYVIGLVLRPILLH